MKRLFPALFLVAALAMGATWPGKSKTHRFHFYLADRWVNGDSGDVITAYPADEDTAGNGTALSWVGGAQFVWTLDVSSTASDVWDFYETAGTDSALVLGKILLGSTAPDSFITDSAQVAVGAIGTSRIKDGGIYAADLADAQLTAAKFASGTSLNLNAIVDTFRVDTLRAAYVYIDSSLNQLGATGQVNFSGELTVTNAEASFQGVDTALELQVGDTLRVTNNSAFATGGDSLSTLNVRNGLIYYADGTAEVTLPSSTSSVQFALPGIRANTLFTINSQRSPPIGGRAVGVHYVFDGVGELEASGTNLSAETFDVTAWNR